jgi:two-component system LytT family response regulator
MTYKVIIVDDELLARQVIRNYLKNYLDMQIICECENGLEATEKINQLKPDVVFLDIQMPELSGLEVIERLDVIPHIVFSTAYDEYAINAFEINAVDYLLKPYDEKRFGKSIRRLRGELKGGIPDLQRMISILEAFHKSNNYLDRILIPNKEEIIFISSTDILYIEAMENYISIITGDSAYLLFQKISEIEKKLNPKQFFRVHRSYIVNLAYIRKIETWMATKYNIILKNGKEIPLSRYRVKAFKRFFGM